MTIEGSSAIPDKGPMESIRRRGPISNKELKSYSEEFQKNATQLESLGNQVVKTAQSAQRKINDLPLSAPANTALNDVLNETLFTSQITTGTTYLALMAFSKMINAQTNTQNINSESLVNTAEYMQNLMTSAQKSLQQTLGTSSEPGTLNGLVAQIKKNPSDSSLQSQFTAVQETMTSETQASSAAQTSGGNLVSQVQTALETVMHDLQQFISEMRSVVSSFQGFAELSSRGMGI